MFALVQLLNGFKKPLTYKIPSKLDGNNLIGKLVIVPLKNKQVSAFVTHIITKFKKKPGFEIKEIIDLHALPKDQLYTSFVEKIAQFYFVKPIVLYQRIQNFLNAKDKKKDIEKHVTNHKPEQPDDVTLTPDQQAIIKEISPLIKDPSFAPSLIHGVTGSGKTEIYKKLITQSIDQQKSVIFLLPEVTLSIQFERIFKKQLPTITIHSFHSASKISEKKALWQDLLQKKPVLIIGVHLPVLLPIAHLGLIIIDEEHETGFQEKKHPKINSKQAALWRAYLYNIPIVLGSATPSLTSLQNVQEKKWRFFQLKKRFVGNFPSIKKVLLSNKGKKRRKSFWVTQELEDALKNCLARNEQAIMYLNRRGYSFFVQCKACGFILECPNCSVSLTLHSRDERSLLRCHYCDYHESMPEKCPECSGKDFLKKGIGTQQVVQIFKKLFPQARIERADLDTTRKKRSWQQTAKDFEEGNIDILIGTKSITKGYHFPSVTLVGILWGDLSLNLPQFNASESTLQELIQVAGRAGRSQKESLVIVQLIQDNDLFDFVSEQTYLTFAKKELEQRSMVLYPPFCTLLCLEFQHSNEQQVQDDALNIARYLTNTVQKNNLPITVLGPAHPVIHKIKRTEIRHIFLKSTSINNVQALVNSIPTDHIESSFFVVRC